MTIDVTKFGWVQSNLGTFYSATFTCDAYNFDGSIDSYEECDDGDYDDYDGCSWKNSIEDGYICWNEPSHCFIPCGNEGWQSAYEQCDDNNAVSGDGCTNCVIDANWQCTNVANQTSVCQRRCGNGNRENTPTVTTAEACDDGDRDSGDGCSSSCTVETNWKCTGGFGSTSVCSPTCGDGVRDNTPTVSTAEACDDGDTSGGDGCSSTCTVEVDWKCTGSFGSASTCGPACGDGV